jgi:DNA-binding transcriptional LysR family regulator
MRKRNLSGVDLNLLVAFDALALELNVTRAAARVGLSQPALSKALNRLRDVFEDPLFVRRDRSMEPTPRARGLVAPIRLALADIARTLAPPAFSPAQASGTFRLAAIDMYEAMLCPRLIGRLRAEAPGVDIRVRPIDRSRLREQLASGEVDLAIAPLAGDDADLLTQLLWRDHLLTLIARTNPLARRLTTPLFAAAGHVVDAGLVQVGPDGAANSVVDAVLASRGLRRRVVVVLPSFSLAPAIVAGTDLVATLPSKIVKVLRPTPGIRVLKPPLPLPDVTSHMIWHRRSDADPLQSWLRALVTATAATL